MLTDAAGSKHLGKALGSAGSFITAGVLTGPVVSGALLQWTNYWTAWAAPLVLLGICFVARFAMLEERPTEKAKSSPEDHQSTDETAPLIATDAINGGHTTIDAEEVKASPSRGFYSIMFSRGSTYAALLNVTAFSMIISGFDTTLPVHLRDEFGWRPAPIGSIFLGIQVPSMIMAPFVGWMRDRIGLRWPTAIGWLCSAPLFWFLGVPSQDGFLGIGAGTRGQAAFVATIIALGIIWSFVRGGESLLQTIRRLVLIES